MPVLLDIRVNVNMITPDCVASLGLQVCPLTDLHKGSITINQPFDHEGQPVGYVVMRVQVKSIEGYNEDQVALVAHSSSEFGHKVLIILGTPTTDRAITVLRESEIDRLATPWASVHKNTLLWAAAACVSAVQSDVATKPIDVMGYEEPIRFQESIMVKPFELLVVKGWTKITFITGKLCCGTFTMNSWYNRYVQLYWYWYSNVS